MAFVKIMVHAVWGTKNRYPFITGDIRDEYFAISVNESMIEKVKGYIDDQEKTSCPKE